MEVLQPTTSHGSMSAMALGENVKKWRKKRGLTQQGLAQRIGVTGSNTISNIERGDTDQPKLETIIALAQALEVRVGVMLGVEKDEDCGTPPGPAAAATGSEMTLTQVGAYLDELKVPADARGEVYAQAPNWASKGGFTRERVEVFWQGLAAASRSRHGKGARGRA